MQRLTEGIVEIVSKIAKRPAAEITPDTDLRADLHVDSLQGLQIIAAVEKKFGVQVADEDLDDYTSVRRIATIVAELEARQAPAASAERLPAQPGGPA